MAALGYMLDPHRLTEVLNSLQEKCNNIEEVSYNPDQVSCGAAPAVHMFTGVPRASRGHVCFRSCARAFRLYCNRGMRA